ncbi:MAG: 16S rRNA (cytosine(1402)-N(4))-methyltransferase RsmH [Alphaproteobacteria bacterium]|nr:16S rRNA (cytosine(1402)-N(4))-methyltransferase RsmH [Alphaproteobacteria bacterium]
MSFSHIPVMLKEVLEWLKPKAGGVYVDGTFGRGGYSKAILNTDGNNINGPRVYGIDRDEQAIAAGHELQKEYAGRLEMLHGRFGDMDKLLAAKGVEAVDGVVLDIGVSSPQFDDAERGFSFRHDGPLDMRMGQDGESAADAVNKLAEKDLADIVFNFGEERFARRVAKAIVDARMEKPITRTHQLATIIRAVVPYAKDGIDPATRSFQALRIYVNQELDQLSNGLTAAEKILKKGGMLVVVSFHSIEDRIVKNFMRERSAGAFNVSRHMPMPVNESKPGLRVMTAKPISPSAEEIARNSRASSARLRAAEKISDEVKMESQNGIICEDSESSETKGV